MWNTASVMCVLLLIQASSAPAQNAAEDLKVLPAEIDGVPTQDLMNRKKGTGVFSAGEKRLPSPFFVPFFQRAGPDQLAVQIAKYLLRKGGAFRLAYQIRHVPFFSRSTDWLVV